MLLFLRKDRQSRDMAQLEGGVVGLDITGFNSSTPLINEVRGCFSVSSIPVIGRGAAICHLVPNQIALTVVEERRKQDDDECQLEV